MIPETVTQRNTADYRSLRECRSIQSYIHALLRSYDDAYVTGPMDVGARAADRVPRAAFSKPSSARGAATLDTQQARRSVSSGPCGRWRAMHPFKLVLCVAIYSGGDSRQETLPRGYKLDYTGGWNPHGRLKHPEQFIELGDLDYLSICLVRCCE